MRFTDDTEASLTFVVDLVNSQTAGADDGDALTAPSVLDAFLDDHVYSGRRDGDDRELDQVRAVRGRLERFWSADDEAAVDEINRMLASARAMPQLVRHDGIDWHVHATGPDAPLAQRIEVEAALALADVVRGGALGQLRRCGADACDDVFIDFSRNGSKRFCSLRCGNRMNVSAYRERRAAAED